MMSLTRHFSSHNCLVVLDALPFSIPLQKSNVLEERTGRSLLMKKIVPPHLLEKRRNELEEEDDDEALSLPTPPGGLQRPNDWRVVDALDDSYREAVSAACEAGA